MARQDLEEEVWDNTISLNPVPSPDSLSQRLLQSQPLPGVAGSGEMEERSLWGLSLPWGSIIDQVLG